MSNELKPVKLSVFARHLLRLTPAASRLYLAKLNLTSVGTDPEVPPAARFVLYAVEFLVIMPIHTDAMRETLDFYWADLLACAEMVVKAVPERKLPQVRFALLDRRFVTLSGTKGFLNIDDQSVTQKLAEQPLETITYDLTALFVRKELGDRPWTLRAHS